MESDGIIRDNSLFTAKTMRLYIALLLMMALFCSTVLRINLGMSMVCMVNSTAFSSEILETDKQPFNVITSVSDLKKYVCLKKTVINEKIDMGYHGTFLWSPSMQSTLFSANFYGGIITIIFSGYLADRFGAKSLLLMAIIDCSVVSFLTPTIASISYTLFFISRMIMGLGEGFVIPTMSSMAARWFPSHERSTAAAIYTSGNQLAGILGLLISSKLCSINFLGGWPLIFYSFGLLGILWSIIWLIFASDEPQTNKWTSENEKQYLKEITLGQIRKIAGSAKFHKPSIPWKKLFLCPPLWANLIAQFSFNFGISFIQSFLPTYLKDILLLPLHQNGLFVMIPYIAMLIPKNIFAIISDNLKKSRILTPTMACKIFQSFGNFGTAIAFFGLAFYVDCTTKVLFTLLLIFYGISFSCGVSGFYTSILSIAPNYTGLMTSICMIFGMIGNATSPNIFSILNKNGTPEEWSRMYIAIAIVNICSGIVFLLFGSADVQDWAISAKTSRVEDIQQNAIKLKISKKRKRTVSDVTVDEITIT
uniref:MFS domain-containing protein n=1 Tax=Strongyloides stercoralis TaxID=6248 RepID=A0A0K0E8J9_STRER